MAAAVYLPLLQLDEGSGFPSGDSGDLTLVNKQRVQKEVERVDLIFKEWVVMNRPQLHADAHLCSFLLSLHQANLN
jgi:hypothetical protein